MSTELPPEIAVRLTDVTKTFGQHKAVDQLSLVVPKGSIYGFIGPNGSGKTTTIRMILHIFHPDKGDIEVLGTRTTRAANDRIGYLPEERGLYKKMTVQRVLAYYGMLKGMSRRDANAAVDPWLERMGLKKWAHQKVEALSKGMAQKVQFIATVLARPELLILDEPFSGLDPVNMESIRAAILDLRAQGTTIIFSTHDMGTAEKLCDFIFMIFKGKKVLDGTLKEIQGTYGADTVRVRTTHGMPLWQQWPGVTVLRDLGQSQEIRVSGNPQEFLYQLCQKTTVQHFEITHPSLHDIFIRIAGAELNATSDEKSV